MSNKFKKPGSPVHAPSEEEIARVIAGAAVDGQPKSGGDSDEEVRFSISLSKEMNARVEKARKTFGLTKVAYLRLAAAEKLARDGQ